MTDIQETADRIREELLTRNIRVMDASFSADAAAMLNGGSTTVEELVDLIGQSFTPFVSIDVTELEREELETAIEANGEVPTEAITRIFDEHTGEAEMLAVHWLHAGVVLEFLEVADWRFELSGLMEAWEADHTFQLHDEADKILARMTHLSDQLEANPEFRAANVNNRRVVGSRLVETMMDGTEDFSDWRVVNDAMAKARENSLTTYMDLRENFTELATELVDSELWRTSNSRATDREAATRQFLLAKADGYAPTADDVKRLRVAAERASGRL